MQKRVSFKETYPSFYDPAPGGVVGKQQRCCACVASISQAQAAMLSCSYIGADESYEQSAEREIEEEMGVKQVKLNSCFDFYHADETSKLWGRLFACTYDGDFKLDPEEVESGEFMSVQASTCSVPAGFARSVPHLLCTCLLMLQGVGL